jgi:hypothetical protein
MLFLIGYWSAKLVCKHIFIRSSSRSGSTFQHYNHLFPYICYSYVYELEYLNCTPYVGWGTISIHCSLFMFTFDLNSFHLFLKLAVFDYLLGISEKFQCSVFAIQARIFFLLDALQLLMLLTGMLTYFKTKLFTLIVFYNDTSFIIKILNVLKMYIGLYKFFSFCIMVFVTALMELLLLFKWYNDTCSFVVLLIVFLLTLYWPLDCE